MNTPASHTQCPAGGRPEGGLIPTSGRDTARIGDYAHTASTSGAFTPCWASDTSPAASAAGAFWPLSGGLPCAPAVRWQHNPLRDASDSGWGPRSKRGRGWDVHPSAAQRNRLSQVAHVRIGARDHRTGWRATECATFRAALDLYRRAA